MKKEDNRFDAEIRKMEAPGGMHICYKFAVKTHTPACGMKASSF